jgi:hypothetical protein
MDDCARGQGVAPHCDDWGVLGFAVFCASYSLLVWRRRNSRNDRQPSRLRRLAYVCIISGAIGLLGTWVFSQLEKRDGMPRTQSNSFKKLSRKSKVMTK